MTLTDIRAELLGRHANIRALMQEVRGVAARVRAGEAVGDALHDPVTRLAAAVAAHNDREEALLRGIIPTVDAWGPARAEIMDESHAREHEELAHAVSHLPRTAREFVDASVEALFHRLQLHMTREEETILCEDVLRDDAVIVEFGG